MPIERWPITNRNEWLQWRTQFICASEIGPITGCGPFGSAARIWAEKRGLIPGIEMNEALKRGRWGEAAVVEAISDEYPAFELRRSKIFLVDRSIRIAATPDCAAIDPERSGLGIIQAKCISCGAFVRHWLCDPTDDPHNLESPAEPPLGYMLQTLTEAHLAEAAWAVLAVLIVDQWRWTLRLFPVERHAGAEAAIRERVSAFWRDFLDPGIQPAIDAERDPEAVDMIFRRGDGSEIDLTTDPNIHAVIAERDWLKADLRGKNERLEQLNALVKEKIGAHTYGRLADERIISWKQNKAGNRVLSVSNRRSVAA